MRYYYGDLSHKTVTVWMLHQHKEFEVNRILSTNWASSSGDSRITSNFKFLNITVCALVTGDEDAQLGAQDIDKDSRCVRRAIDWMT